MFRGVSALHEKTHARGEHALWRHVIQRATQTELVHVDSLGDAHVDELHAPLGPRTVQHRVCELHVAVHQASSVHCSDAAGQLQSPAAQRRERRRRPRVRRKVEPLRKKLRHDEHAAAREGVLLPLRAARACRCARVRASHGHEAVEAHNVVVRRDARQRPQLVAHGRDVRRLLDCHGRAVERGGTPAPARQRPDAHQSRRQRATTQARRGRPWFQYLITTARLAQSPRSRPPTPTVPARGG